MLTKFSISTLMLLIFYCLPKVDCQTLPLTSSVRNCESKDLTIREAIKWTHKRHIQHHGLDSKYTYDRYYLRNKILSLPEFENKIDSIFENCKHYLIQQFGEEEYCNKVRIDDEFLYLYTRNKDQKLTGKFNFYFYFENTSHRNGYSKKIEFNFEESDLGIITIKYPSALPNCFPGNCSFEYNSFTDIIYKGIEEGVIDPRFNLRCDKSHNEFIISYSPLPYLRRTISIDNKEGEITKDTLTNSKQPFNVIASYKFDKLVKFSEHIVDATCVEKADYEKGSLSYARYIFEVHHILKGDSIENVIAIDAYTGMHSTFRAKLGQRSLMFLGAKNRNPYQLKTFKSTYPHWDGATLVSLANYPNIYSELYPFMVKNTGTKIKSNSINYIHDDIRSWLEENGKNELVDKNGLVLGLSYSSWSKDNSTVNTRVNLGSIKDFTYLTKKEFMVIYDTSFVGSYAVKNQNAQIDPFYSNTSIGGDKIPQTKLGNFYQIDLIDVAPDKFKVQITPKDLDRLAQINPAVLDPLKYNNIRPQKAKKLDKRSIPPFLQLKFKVVKQTEKEIFEVKLEADSFNIQDKHFNFHSNKEETYAYQYIFKKASQLDIKDKKIIIDKVSPRNYMPGDTITVHGENLNSVLDKIHCPCNTEKNEILFSRYCKITSDQIIESSFDKVSFRVPLYYDFNHQGLEKMNPSSGRIKIKYTYSIDTLNLIE